MQLFINYNGSLRLQRQNYLPCNGSKQRRQTNLVDYRPYPTSKVKNCENSYEGEAEVKALMLIKSKCCLKLYYYRNSIGFGGIGRKLDFKLPKFCTLI